MTHRNLDSLGFNRNIETFVKPLLPCSLAWCSHLQPGGLVWPTWARPGGATHILAHHSFVSDLTGPWTEADHSGMSASSSAGSNGRARRWAHAKTHAHANASRSNPIQWHRSWPQCAANCLISLWPRSSFLSTFFQVFGRDLFSLSALFKDLLYAGSPPDVVLQSSHCLSFSPSLSFSLHTSLRPASPLSPTLSL